LLYLGPLLALVNGPLEADTAIVPRTYEEEHAPLPLPPQRAARSPGPEPPRAGPLVDTAVILVGLLIGVATILALLRRYLPGLNAAARGHLVQIMGRTSLDAKGTVYVVRCGPRVLVLGATNSQISTLAEIADPEEIAQFVSAPRSADSEPARSASSTLPTNIPELKGQVDELLERIDRWKSTA
jgi:flagellar protein FliO/FliZ